MQDYNYVFANCYEITVHLSCERNFSEFQFINIFNENLNSIKEFVKQVY